jgi:hypothetical protein
MTMPEIIDVQSADRELEQALDRAIAAAVRAERVQEKLGRFGGKDQELDEFCRTRGLPTLRAPGQVELHRRRAGQLQAMVAVLQTLRGLR